MGVLSILSVVDGVVEKPCMASRIALALMVVCARRACGVVTKSENNKNSRNN